MQIGGLIRDSDAPGQGEMQKLLFLTSTPGIMKQLPGSLQGDLEKSWTEKPEL